MSPLAYECFRRRTARIRIAPAIGALSYGDLDDLFGFLVTPAPGIRALANTAEEANVAYFVATTRHFCP